MTVCNRVYLAERSIVRHEEEAFGILVRNGASRNEAVEWKASFVPLDIIPP